MKVFPFSTVRVIPSLPENMKRLNDLAYNFLWSWNHDISALFRSLNPTLWESVNQNPVRMLNEIPQSRLNELAHVPEFVSHLERCASYLDHYLNETTWFQKLHGDLAQKHIVFFSMEYGLSECLPLYSGGLGVLSGDYLKAASDLGLPVVGIGLAYRQGYFQQELASDGWQIERYPENDFQLLPMEAVYDNDGALLIFPIPFDDRELFVRVWKVQVGRVSLFVLDTDVEQNSEADRQITHALYGGDRETRIQQEIVLGFGGVEALRRMGIDIFVCHMNEGHSAFVQLGRVAQEMKSKKLSWQEARQLVSAGTLFTTHTPVPAGIDSFSPGLMNKYFVRVYRELGLSKYDVMELGNPRPGTADQEFNMAVCALRTSDYTNGVSRLHADVARRMWSESWPDLQLEDVPIEHVTNGIHLMTWIAPEMTALYDRYFDKDWRRSDDKAVWSKVHAIPDEELWHAHVTAKNRMIQFARKRVTLFRSRTIGVTPTTEEIAKYLHPDHLTIGFARRFATYKRALLLFRKPERLLAILKNERHPVQFVFAGKAHPQDVQGKDLIREIYQFAEQHHVEHKLLFIENYDMNVARHLVEGVDVWLNTPKRPLEASGTSGMKVLGNGGLNLSILDGWWDEAYSPEVGWQIGGGRQFDEDYLQDEHDSNALFVTLEKQLIPLYYKTDEGTIPRKWVQMMKNSTAELVPRFSARRMVMEYWTEYYLPALQRRLRLESGGLNGIRELAEWRERVEAGWPQVRIEHVESDRTGIVAPGDRIRVLAAVHLGDLRASDVEAQICIGNVNGDGTIRNVEFVNMEIEQADGVAVFRGEVNPESGGTLGMAVRIIPSHPLLGNPLRLGLVNWTGVKTD